MRMDTDLAQCIFCLKEYPANTLTNEHIIPEALGSDFFLPKASCKVCQEACNKAFESRLLKGSNLIGLMRAQLGLKGKRNVPIFGMDKHGMPMEANVEDGFPGVRVGFIKGGMIFPLQVILTQGDQSAPEHYFLPPDLQQPIPQDVFDSLVKDIPADITNAYLWANGDLITYNGWNKIHSIFIDWCKKNQIEARASTSNQGMDNIPFEFELNTEERNRAFAKICYTYLLSVLPKEKWFNPALNSIRKYVLHGGLSEYTPDPGTINQWRDQIPAAELLHEHAPGDYILSIVTHNEALYGLLFLPVAGLFAVKLTHTGQALDINDNVTVYTLNRANPKGVYGLTSTKIPQAVADVFIQGVKDGGLIR